MTDSSNGAETPRSGAPVFVSTRGGSPATLDEALFRGLAPDGGLYVPHPMPRLEGTAASVSAPARDFPSTVASMAGDLFQGHLEPEAAREVADAAVNFPVPLVEIGRDTYVLELFHGPSCAFKDVGARFMAELMVRLEGSAERGRGGERTVLVATSGDTGSAVARAFHGHGGYRVVVLFPKDGVSIRQRRQMTTLGGNVVAIAVRGTFDDCQALVKRAFVEPRLRRGHRLTSANSINVGRLLPQTLYYLYAATRLGRPPRFVVPSGNLGNLCAGLLAHIAGMETAGFVAATNANDGFVRWMEGGGGEKQRTKRTVSSAMDVSRPSNLERIEYLFRDRPGALRRLVKGVSVDDEATIDALTRWHRRYGYRMDPHTAVAVRAHELVPAPEGTPSVILSTAHPAKFPEVALQTTGTEAEVPTPIRAALTGPESWMEADPELDDLERVLDGAARAVERDSVLTGVGAMARVHCSHANQQGEG